jgi:hypothetical protein
MAETHWKLTVQYPKGEDTVVASGLRGTMPTVTRGETSTFKLGFGRDVPDSVSARSNIERYELARELLDWAGWVTIESAVTQPTYREHLPSDADIDSLVVKIEPADGVQSGVGVWGVVMGREDKTRLAPNAVLVLGVHVLAEASEYSAYSDVVAAFQPDIK